MKPLLCYREMFNLLIKLQPLLTFLWTTFVLVLLFITLSSFYTTKCLYLLYRERMREGLDQNLNFQAELLTIDQGLDP